MTEPKAALYHVNPDENDETDAFDYIKEAHVTASEEFHGEAIWAHAFAETVAASIDALQKLDKMKKAIFYGRNLSEVSHAKPPLEESLGAFCSMPVNLMHGIIGLATEAGELLEALQSSELDSINIAEEVGDCFWYIALILKETGFNFDEIQHINIEKLRARFPDKFDANKANNRSLIKEREVLETKIGQLK